MKLKRGMRLMHRLETVIGETRGLRYNVPP